VIADMRAKGGRVRTVAVPLWIKQGINTWLAAAELEEGRLLRAVGKSGKVFRGELRDWAVWSVVQQSAKQIGVERFGAHDLRRTCAKLCRKSGGASIVASGGSAERVRSYLKKISDETWQLTNWLTHAASATRPDAMLALAATENVVTSFVPMVLRAKIAAPARCGRCKSYKLAIDWRSEIDPLGAYVVRCQTCGAEALRTDDVNAVNQ